MLATAAVQGDAKAFGLLIARHYDRIYRVAWRVLGAREAAEDMAQDVCAALPAKLSSFRADAKFSTWLYTVTMNAARDRLRRRATRARANEGWAETTKLAQAQAAEASADQEWLAEAMIALPEDLRETVALTLGEDLTHAEAAEALGVSQGTVSWRMSEVKRRLRAMVEEQSV